MLIIEELDAVSFPVFVRYKLAFGMSDASCVLVSHLNTAVDPVAYVHFRGTTFPVPPEIARKECCACVKPGIV
jgi:hypothetical protein